MSRKLGTDVDGSGTATSGWSGYRVADREPTKSVRRDGERNVHLPSILYLIEDVEALLMELEATAAEEGRMAEVAIMQWLKVKIVGHLRRTYDRQRKRAMRFAATPQGKAILEAELKLAQEGATKVRKKLEEVAALEEQLLSRTERLRNKRKHGVVAKRGPRGSGLAFIDPKTGKAVE